MCKKWSLIAFCLIWLITKEPQFESILCLKESGWNFRVNQAIFLNIQSHPDIPDISLQ